MEDMNIYNEFSQYLGDFRVQLISLLIDLLENFENTALSVRILAKFFKDNPKAFPGIKQILKSPMFNEFFQNVLKLDNEMVNAIKNILFEQDEVLDLFFDIISHTEIIDNFADIFANYENMTFLYYHLPQFLKNLSDYDSDYVTRILNSFTYLGGLIYGEKFLGEFINRVQASIKKFFVDLDVDSYGITHDCNDLFNHTIFEYNSAWNKVLFLYLKNF